MTAPADAAPPEPAPADVGLPEPAPADADAPEPGPPEVALPESASADAGLAQSAPANNILPHPAPADAGLPEPAPPEVALQKSASRDGGTPVSAPLGIPQHLRGHYAGFASRFSAFIFDCVVSIGIFLIVLGAASFTASVLTGSSIHWSRDNWWVVVGFFAWEFFYYAYFWTSSGKTPGMFLLGVQVVGEDGSSVGSKRGLVRTLAFPLSFILLGLGFLGILLGRDRRALHDAIAGTAVVYCWDAREARLRSLARQSPSRRR
jgi:uncharacterized RDD family membrane protein YckC